jgi:non-specific serine/threonine protein kinase
MALSVAPDHGDEAAPHPVNVAATFGLATGRALGTARATAPPPSATFFACGVLLHVLLHGEAVLGSPDIAQVLSRIAPYGREHVRLPWTTPAADPGAAARASPNRSTASQVRLR